MSSGSKADFGLYTDDDPLYYNTRLEFTIPPPSVKTVPRNGGHINMGAVDNRYGLPRDGGVGQPSPSTSRNILSNGIDIDVKGADFIVLRRAESTSLPNLYDSSGYNTLFSINQQTKLSNITRISEDLCDVKIAQAITDAKNKQRHIPEKIILRAKAAANPFDNVCLGAFTNRSSVELGCVDHLFRFSSLSQSPNKELKFVDAGGEMGGASEYALWRSRTKHTTGAGWVIGRYTRPLQAKNHPLIERDIERLKLFNSQVKKDPEFAGDFTALQDIRDFSKLVSKETRNANGVDVVFATGVQQNTSRIHANRISGELRPHYQNLCQILLLIRTLRPGGDFVFKMANTTTILSAQAIYILHLLFEKLAIVKPLASYPSSSERYAICHEYKGIPSAEVVEAIESILSDIVDGKQIPGFINWDVVCQDDHFMKYINCVNAKYDAKQLDALNAILRHANNP
ncbi:hypothetical protein H4219_000254 [Mycoemilia scoparia]|uniref:Cap-specific mRNA (nucleoside-2'-O-)-methyltransferase 1 n=1 Tax=Mycoemilia scoparia TaxID=417184 RepID=A0A9W8DRN4_9FUNG|nr:hypothetical protein H4219_000254 [Mycoemilia scoparia]